MLNHRIKILLILVFLSLNSYSQTSIINQKQKYLSEYCKLWGFIKYNYINKSSKLDWDKYALNSIEKITENQSLNTLNNVIANTLAIVKTNTKETAIKKFNIDTSLFNNENKILFEKILKTKTVRRKKYVKDNLFGEAVVPKFRHEKAYKNSEILQPEYRLLALFKYWNVIKYYYPTLDSSYNWDEILYNYIPKFIAADSKVKYHFLVLKLNALLKDSHSTYMKSAVLHEYTNAIYPVEFGYSNGNTIINELYYATNKSVNIGDTVIKINNKNIEDIRDSLHKYISASTINYMEAKTSDFLRIGLKDTLIVTLNTGRIIYFPKFNNMDEYHKLWFKIHYSDSLIVQDSVLYLSRIDAYKSKKEIKKIINSPEISTIIIDYRKVEMNFTKAYFLVKFLTKNFCPPSTHYLTFSFPNWKYPGRYINKKRFTNKKSKNRKDKKIVLIIDEGVQSHGETFVLALQQNPNIVTIGNITSGADGQVVSINMPDNITMVFSGLGAYFPSGEMLQRKGITPDIFMSNKEIKKYIYKELKL